MEIIKYKFWDKEENNFIEDFGTYGLDHTGTLSVICGPFGEAWTESLEDHAIIPLQYTNIKDKNGVEIYDGDIVKIGKVVWEIHWFRAGFVLKRTTVHGHLQVRRMRSLKEGVVHPDMEVIGNKFKNPELLNNK